MKHSSRAVALAFLLLFLFVPPAAEAQRAPLRGLDAYIERAMRDWEVPGLALAVVKDDSVVFARGYGVRELGRPERVDEHTVFAIASTTKAMSAASLGMLVDEGKLKWDDPATQHLRGFQLADPYVTRELTVRDLLSHRSGLPRGDLLWWASPYDRAEVLQRVRHLQPGWGFRAQYGYQNIMFLAAGELLAEVAGTTWDNFMGERLFRPLGMTRSSTTVHALQGMENVATPHERIENAVRPIPWRSYDNLGAAGSVNSSVHDMAQWIRLNLNRGEYRGQRLLSDSVVKEMQTPQTVIRTDTLAERLYPHTHFRAYGLGWSLQDYRGHKMVHHGGALDGMRTHVAMIPEEKLGVVVIANMEPTTLHVALVYRILDAYLGAPARDWSADLLAVANRQRREAEQRQDSIAQARVAGTSPSLPLERYAGSYSGEMYGQMQVAHEDGRLVLRFGPSWAGDLEHWHYDTFRVTWRDPSMGRSFVTFALNAAGRVERMQIENFGDLTRQADPETTTAAGRQ
ncbi:MAG TPA: serine hydrolase [Longimicrobiaceae bacterium]|nr:serine hydrolase [Longimicrobiaceae bacterium]